MVRADKSIVCVFPINGTRRWFMLEHAHTAGDDPVAAYMDIAGRNHIGLYRLFFEHGVDTLITPVFGTELFNRGDEYVQRIGMDGLSRLAAHPDFVNFYDEHQVRVRFYGDYRTRLKDTPYAGLSNTFDAITEHTRHYDHHRLFFGVFASDATATVAEFSVKYHQEHGKIPDRRTLIEMYYGEYVHPADIFIGFDKFSIFDYPLLASGEEDLYFTVAPSPYLDQTQLRQILYDHLYTRRGREPDYATLPPEDWQWMQSFYRLNRHVTLGIGQRRAGLWFPLGDITWPETGASQ